MSHSPAQTVRQRPKPNGSRLTAFARIANSRRPEAVRALATVSLLVVISTCPARALAYRTFEHDPGVDAPAVIRSESLEWQVSGRDATGQELEAVIDAARAAMAAWSQPDCTRFGGTVSATPAMSAAAAGDGRFSIEIVHAWDDRDFEAGRGATTDVQLIRSSDGSTWIAEADIYLDFEHHEWGDAALDPSVLDLGAVLTHEIGHALGLLHPCGIRELGLHECDHADQLSVLYPLYLGVQQRMPGADDLAGVCALYPTVPLPTCSPACEAGLECVDGTCLRCADGECASYCPPDGCVFGSCEMGACARGVCSSAGDNEGMCVEAGAFGTSCDSAIECSSRLCLRGHPSGWGYCTTLCAHDADCGGMQHCEDVSGRRVCAPLPPSTSSCSVGARPRLGCRPLFGALVIICAAIANRGSRRRSK